VTVVTSPSTNSATTPAVRHFLHWGQVVVEGEGARLATIVGSCVAVCLWEGRSRVGGMNHYLLPEAPHVRDLPNPWSYGDLALPELHAKMLAVGASAHGLSARIYGGASITQADDQGGPGSRNVDLARGWLGSHGIPIVAHEVGGRHGRKIVFDTATGGVTVSTL
jgi:chemotaxis protein CheD